MISRPNLNKPRVKQLRLGGRTVQSGLLPEQILYVCYGFVMVFEPGRPSINEVRVIGHSIENAYENFMRVYGRFFPEQRNRELFASEPHSGCKQQAGVEAEQTPADRMGGVSNHGIGDVVFHW